MKKICDFLLLPIVMTAVLAVLLIPGCQVETEQIPAPALAQDGREEESIPPMILVSTDAGKQYIRLWQDSDGALWAFLPSFADVQTACFQSEAPVLLDGIPVENGIPLQITLGKVYTLSWAGRETDLTFLQSQNVAAMFIDLPLDELEVISLDKEKHAAAAFTVVDTLSHAETSVGIIGARGNATFESEKKPFSIAFETDTKMLSMAATKKWVLLSNCYDDSNLRNKLVYDFSQNCGLPWSPACKYVEVYVSGEYRGLYLLAEKVEVAPNRIAPDFIGEDGFLAEKTISQRALTKNNPLVLDNGLSFTLRYPISLNNAAKNRIADVLTNVHNALQSRDWALIQTLIDADSWARRYLIDEIFQNYDMNSTSCYYCYDGSTLYAGPVWDYDNSMRNLASESGDFGINEILGADLPWIHELLSIPEFQNRTAQIYREWLPDLEQLMQELPARQAAIQDAALANKIRWKGIFNEDVSQFCSGGGDFLQSFMEQRIRCLNTYFLDGKPLPITPRVYPSAVPMGTSQKYYTAMIGCVFLLFMSTAMGLYLYQCRSKKKAEQAGVPSR